MKAFLGLFGSILIASSLLSGGAALADDNVPVVPLKNTVSANGVLSNAGGGAAVEYRHKGTDDSGSVMDVQAGLLRNYDGHDRLIGNVGAYGLCADVLLCIGSPRIVHADGKYEQISPLAISFGGIGADTTFFIGPRVFFLRDVTRGQNFAGFGGDAFYDHTIGHGGDLSVLAQIATTYGGSDNAQTEGLFYELEAKYRKMIAAGWAANAGFDVSDNMVKQLDASGNPVGSFSTNTSVTLTGGLTKLW